MSSPDEAAKRFGEALFFAFIGSSLAAIPIVVLAITLPRVGADIPMSFWSGLFLGVFAR